MSSLSFCQGLQSCLEPCFKEPRVLGLNLAPRNSIFSRSDSPPNSSSFIPIDTLKNESHTEDNNAYIPANTNSHDCDLSEEIVDLGGWSFLQCINNVSSNPETDKVYVHPLVKLSALSLSSKSLEMCTESLCSETGSDQISQNGDDISMFLTEAEPEICISKEEPPKLPQSLSFERKRTNRCVSFPPPLTSVSGFQVRPHREGGRLVLEAVAVSSSHTYFHAERRAGRLRLSLIRDKLDEEEEEEEEDFGEEEVDDEEEHYDYEEAEEADLCEDIEENNKKIKDENGGENLRRPSGCKEDERGNKGLLTWEPYWVAT
ncbi:protein FANTASTIC FOUR 2-like [Mangifera indica]|uniref:protein FANTASTIC FOUR 2-like n=1 Tax=Mangifera indica TaxID=29780 RepID=UPI001CFB0DA5|nr:protein FANTASTIC FOUR 2-like [Mangifera indica]